MRFAVGARRSRSPQISSFADLRLPEAQHFEFEHAVLRFGAHDPADDVALLRPDLQHAALALGAQRELCRAEVEQHLAVLDDQRRWGIGDDRVQLLGDELVKGRRFIPASIGYCFQGRFPLPYSHNLGDVQKRNPNVLFITAVFVAILSYQIY